MQDVININDDSEYEIRIWHKDSIDTLASIQIKEGKIFIWSSFICNYQLDKKVKEKREESNDERV